MREHEQAFRKKGARLAAVGLGDRNYARLFREETGITFPLLIDENREAYRAAGLRSASLLHLLRGNNAAARKRAKTAGHSSHVIRTLWRWANRQHSLGKNPFQLGGSFIFCPGNVDRYAHLSETFADNASPAALLAALP